MEIILMSAPRRHEGKKEGVFTRFLNWAKIQIICLVASGWIWMSILFLPEFGRLHGEEQIFAGAGWLALAWLTWVFARHRPRNKRWTVWILSFVTWMFLLFLLSKIL